MVVVLGVSEPDSDGGEVEDLLWYEVHRDRHKSRRDWVRRNQLSAAISGTFTINIYTPHRKMYGAIA